jgi:CubicO group peptidase (beta-lactamase class C family)
VSDAPIGGHCDPRFAAVERAFRGNFAERGELGGAVCVVHRGEVVVDLVGGWADEARTRAWTAETIVDVYSVGKAILGLLLLQLVDDGTIDLDQPISDIWPGFTAGGATIEHVLTHRAGVPAIREPLTDDDLMDWGVMTDALAATEPWWVPGERIAYHTNTFGHLVGELVHRASGRMPGDRLRAVAEETEADLWFGVPEDEQHRCADIVWDPERPLPALTSFDGIEGDLLMNALAHFNPPGYSSIGLVNTPAWRALPLGSTAGHGSAAGIARLYAALLEPGRLLSPALLARASVPQASGPCPILGDELTYGLGFQPTTARRPLGPNPRSFGHYGSGGALGFADPDAGIAFGYAMNHLIPRWQSTRNRALVDAVYACLGA